MFISQYNSLSKNKNFYNEDIKISFDDYHAPTNFLLNNVKKYCKEKKLILQILSKKGDKIEKEYYKKMLNSKFEFVSNKKRGDGYKYVDDSDMVVGIDSTLVYETLSRKKKIGIFAVREDYFRNKYFKKFGLEFGWPYKFKKKGFFWTNDNSYLELKRIFDLILNMKQSKWEHNLSNPSFKKLMLYDTNNTILKNKIKLILRENA